MYTAGDYPNIEHAITRTHDALVPDSKSGKMVLGPNNWTNSNDGDMPEFGSKPGMKMFALTGTGWASREVAIDANAALLPVVDRKSTRLNSSHVAISYAVFCLKKKSRTR